MPLEWPFKTTPHSNINNFPYIKRMDFIKRRVYHWFEQLENV